MNELFSALQISDFAPLLEAYKRAGIDLHSFIDGGAGMGSTSTKMLAHLNPNETIYAFEPFQGNHRFFEGLDRRIKLIPQALAEKRKTSCLYVGSTVSEDTAWGKQGFVGYSSVGKLTDISATSEKHYQVDCVAADEVISQDCHIGFVKLDLQGGELNALRGMDRIARNALLMWIEYLGDSRELYEYICDLGYMLFDTEYMFLGECSAAAQSEFYISRKDVVLSNNLKAWFGFRKKPWHAFHIECAALKRSYGLIQTDLVCINRLYLKEFVSAISYILD